MKDVFICDAIRTPIGRYGGALAAVRADDLAVVPLKALMARNPGVDWGAVDGMRFFVDDIRFLQKDGTPFVIDDFEIGIRRAVMPVEGLDRIRSEQVKHNMAAVNMSHIKPEVLSGFENLEIIGDSKIFKFFN